MDLDLEKIIETSVAVQLGVKPEEVTILNSYKRQGSGNHENFLGELRSLDIDAMVNGKKSTHHFMAKFVPQTEKLMKFLEETNSWDVERLMYYTVLPAINKTYADKAGDGRGLSHPQVFYANKEEGIIIMENLKSQGFHNEDRIRGLDERQSQLVLRQLALLHGLSYYYIDTYPKGGLDGFVRDYPQLNTDSTWINTSSERMANVLNGVIGGTYKITMDVVQEYCKDDPVLVSKVCDLFKVLPFVIKKIHKVSGPFNCLLHNDAWTNNFMFKKDSNNETVDVKLIDFQLSRRARPTVDLAYFFGTSTNVEFREKYMDSLLKYYHSKLEKALIELGYGSHLYPYETFMEDFKECYTFGFVMTSFHSQVAYTSHEEAPFDMELAMDPDKHEETMSTYMTNQLKSIKTNEKLKKRLIDACKEAQRMGII